MACSIRTSSGRRIPHAFRKLDPRLLIKNPVMFVVEITAVLVTADGHRRCRAGPGTVAGAASKFPVQIADLAVVHGPLRDLRRGGRRGSRTRPGGDPAQDHVGDHRAPPAADGTLEDVGSSELRKGDVIVVEEGETIAGDGDVIEGIGFVNEAAITGESAPVLKEPGTDIRSSVTGGTTLVSDRIVVLVTTDPGETFLDRMIALVEGAKRQRTPNEIALAILLAGLTIIFLMATVTLRPFGEYAGTTVDTVALIALLVCLIPTTIGGLLSAIGIAGMDRVARFNVLAMSGRAVEASGDVDVILLDKTGTITYGNRLAASIIAGAGVTEAEARRGRPVSPRSMTRRRRVARSSSSPASGLPSSAARPAPATTAGLATLDSDHRRGDRLPRRDPHERGHDDVRDHDPEGRGRRDREEGRRPARAGVARRPTGSPTSAPRRWSSRAKAASSASSSSRTRSRRASSSASPSSAGWASGP